MTAFGELLRDVRVRLDARLEEAQTGARDLYSLVYEAERPELFLKDAGMRRTVGPGGAIRVRRDSSWMVPEPELGLVLGDYGEPVAVYVRVATS